MVPRNTKTLKSGEVAKAAGVSVDTIRHYEKLGLLPRALRTGSGYRVFPGDAVERVLIIQRSLRIGFTLAELSEVLKARDIGQTPCGRVYQLAQEKLKAIAADIEALKRTERQLKNVLADWNTRMQRAGEGQKSHLLYSLSEALKHTDPRTNQFRRKKKP
jgi:DNA-binding transcriptional MerR regulator